MNSIQNKGAFTIIELLVAMTIFFLVSSVSYVPYSYYQNKAKVKQTAKEISQLLYNSRNIAINGISNTDQNRSIAVYFDSSDEHNEKIQIFSYPHTLPVGFDILQSESITSVQEVLLQPGVELAGISSGGEEYASGLFLFSAIHGNGTYFGNQTTPEALTENIQISFSYGGADSSSPLYSSVTYYPATNIVDY